MHDKQKIMLIAAIAVIVVAGFFLLRNLSASGALPGSGPVLEQKAPTDD